MNNAKKIQLSARLFEQIWSSSNLNPNRVTHELNKIFTNNEEETCLRNDSQKYFVVNRDALVSLTSVDNESTGGLHVNSWFNENWITMNNISPIKLDMTNNDLTDRSFEIIVQLLSVNCGLAELSLTENCFSNETKEQCKALEEKYGVDLH